MIRWVAEKMNVYVLLAALVIAAVLVGLAIALLYIIPPAASARPATALTVIPGPTSTSTSPAVTPSPIPTEPVTVGGIAIGNYVKISGTEGSGLRLRAEPSTAKPMLFVGMDEEVFLVKDGPREADGYTWWYLQAPYDDSRSGWAVSQYLTVIQEPANP